MPTGLLHNEPIDDSLDEINEEEALKKIHDVSEENPRETLEGK